MVRGLSGATTNMRTVVPSAEVNVRCSVRTGGTVDRTGGGLLQHGRPPVGPGEVEPADLRRGDQVRPADPEPAVAVGGAGSAAVTPRREPRSGQRDGAARRAVEPVQRQLADRVAAAAEHEQAVGGVVGARGLEPVDVVEHRVGVLGDQLAPVRAVGGDGVGDGEPEARGAVGGAQVEPAVAGHPGVALHVVGLGEQRAQRRDRGAGGAARRSRGCRDGPCRRCR